jgi:hypothetical protein
VDVDDALTLAKATEILIVMASWHSQGAVRST